MYSPFDFCVLMSPDGPTVELDCSDRRSKGKHYGHRAVVDTITSSASLIRDELNTVQSCTMYLNDCIEYGRGL